MCLSTDPCRQLHSLREITVCIAFSVQVSSIFWYDLPYWGRAWPRQPPEVPPSPAALLLYPNHGSLNECGYFYFRPVEQEVSDVSFVQSLDGALHSISC